MAGDSDHLLEIRSSDSGLEAGENSMGDRCCYLISIAAGVGLLGRGILFLRFIPEKAKRRKHEN
jgi:hypothetical protein